MKQLATEWARIRLNYLQYRIPYDVVGTLIGNLYDFLVKEQNDEQIWSRNV